MMNVARRMNTAQSFGRLDVSGVSRKERAVVTKELQELGEEFDVRAKSHIGIQASLIPPRLSIRPVYEVGISETGKTPAQKVLHKMGLFPEVRFTVAKQGIENNLGNFADWIARSFLFLSDSLGEKKAAKTLNNAGFHRNF